MGTIRKLATGEYRAEVRRKTPDGPFYRSATFAKRAEAQVWLGRTESEFKHRGRASGSHTLADALRRYREEVSPLHRGARWEALRLRAWEALPWARTRLDRLTPDAIGKWRDRRLQGVDEAGEAARAVSPATVRRELGLLSLVLEEARREWGWISVNPARDARKPAKPPPRTRRISPAEEEALLQACGYARGAVPETLTEEVAVAFSLSLETAMRAGEIVGLTWDRVDLERRVARLPLTKNGTARDVPLSAAAVGLLRLMDREKPGSVFGLTSASLDALWRKARDRAARFMPELATIHFHDARAEATTRLARKFDVMTLSKITGHRDIKLLVDTYYRVTAEEIAGRMSRLSTDD